MGLAILLFAIIAASLIIIRAGSIALELTGMDPEKARFQALSAFTNTGFTTREAEEITNFPIRRRIVTVLIVFGYAETVGVIATFATSLFQRTLAYSLIRIAIILVSVYIVYRFASWRGFTRPIADAFRRFLVKRYGIQQPSLEQMLRFGEGFGVIRAVVQPQSPLIGRPLAELNLKAHQIQLLTIFRKDEMIAIPSGFDVLLEDDVIVCYGYIQAVKRLFPESTAPVEPPAETSSV
jgi:hypothetical protein